MAVQQVAASYQNDGNFAQLDLQDVANNGPRFRIETYRSSQPADAFGTNLAGSRVDYICGIDHLKPGSNKVFRSIDSVSRNGEQVVILEIREAIEPTGAFFVRARDVDADSATFGHVIVCSAIPLPRNKYQINYEIRVPRNAKPTSVYSPLTESMSSKTGLSDIGEDLDNLGEIDSTLPGNPLRAEIQWNGSKSEIYLVFREFETIIQTLPQYEKFKTNIIFYLRMGDFRDKCIHDGTNLTGPLPALASEFVLIRAYRKSLMMLGRIADIDMYKHTLGGMSPMMAAVPLMTDPKPGVYTPFLTAYISNVEVYQLGLDKVHSDYGGIPMKLAPGSRLETGATPIVDSTRLNQSLAEIAFAYYTAPHPVAAKALSAFALL
ncbi:hypothetical protein ACT53J_07115 [Citrobacter braakii]|uniref:hypothetical protein n=1 Tax=Citrobacter braakii TaxID=57706 RepID=UPI0040333B00